MRAEQAPPPSLFLAYHELRFAAVATVGSLRGMASGFGRNEPEDSAFNAVARTLTAYADELDAVLKKQGVDLASIRPKEEEVA